VCHVRVCSGCVRVCSAASSYVLVCVRVSTPVLVSSAARAGIGPSSEDERATSGGTGVYKGVRTSVAREGSYLGGEDVLEGDEAEAVPHGGVDQRVGRGEERAARREGQLLVQQQHRRGVHLPRCGPRSFMASFMAPTMGTPPPPPPPPRYCLHVVASGGGGVTPEGVQGGLQDACTLDCM
jgi:hypothetical protein